MSQEWYFPKHSIVYLYLSGSCPAWTSAQQWLHLALCINAGLIQPHYGLLRVATWVSSSQYSNTSLSPYQGNLFLWLSINALLNELLAWSSMSFSPWALPTCPPHNITLDSCSFENKYRNPFADESASCQLTSTFSPSSFAFAHKTWAKCPSAAFDVPFHKSSSHTLSAPSLINDHYRAVHLSSNFLPQRYSFG